MFSQKGEDPTMVPRSGYEPPRDELKREGKGYDIVSYLTKHSPFEEVAVCLCSLGKERNQNRGSLLLRGEKTNKL